MSFSWQLNHCSNSTATKELSFSSASISLFFSFIAAPCNLLICVTIYKDPHKSLRTPFNLLILNVAIADLIQGIVVLPLSATYHALEGFQSPLSQLLKPLHLFFFISCTASIMSIGALAVDRCIAVSYPLKYRSTSSYSRSVRISILIWLLSVGLSFVYFHVNFIMYTFVFVNCVILVTVCVLLVVQYWAKKSLKNHRERREFRLSMEINKQIKVSSFDGYMGRMVKRHTRMTRTFLAILLVFLLLSTPSFVFAYALNFCTTCSCNTYHVFRDLHFLFVLFPSSVNPFLFGLRLPHFKRALMVIISRKKRNHVYKTNASQIDLTSTAEHGLSSSQHRRRSTCPGPSTAQKSTFENNCAQVPNKKYKIRNNGNNEIGIVNKELNCFELDKKGNHESDERSRRSFKNTPNNGNHKGSLFKRTTLGDYRLTSRV